MRPDAPREPSGAGLVVATYNVHRCIGRDGRHDVGRVADVLRELDADVIALQELSIRTRGAGAVDQCDHLARACGMFAIRGSTLRSPEGEIANAVLTRFPPRRVAHLDLSQSNFEPRAAIDVELRAGSRSLRVVATHLGLDRSERRAQTGALLASLDEHRADVTVVLGDANEWMPFGGTNRGLDRVMGSTSAPRTFPAWRPILALDRVWVRPRERVERVEAHASDVARMASDHLPVRAIITWGSMGRGRGSGGARADPSHRCGSAGP